MKLVAAILCLLGALAFAIVSLPAALTGGRQPLAASLEQAAEGLLPRGQDFTFSGVLVRGEDLNRQRIGGEYYLPLLDEASAQRLAEYGGWRRPSLAVGGRVVLARLSLEEVHGRGLAWNESQLGTAALGPFVLAGVVRPSSEAGPELAAMLDEFFELQPSEVLIIDHGASSFDLAAALTGLGIAMVLGLLAWRCWRSRSRSRELMLEGHAESGQRQPLASCGALFGGVGAAVVGLLAVFARNADNLGRTLGTHADEAARGLARNSAEAAGLGRSLDDQELLELFLRGLEAADTADAVKDAYELLAPEATIRGSLQILGGHERYRYEGSDDSWHLVEGEMRFRLEVRQGEDAPQSFEHASVVVPNRAIGEDVRLSFRQTPEGGFEAVFSETFSAEDARDIPASFSVLLKPGSTAGLPEIPNLLGVWTLNEEGEASYAEHMELLIQRVFLKRLGQRAQKIHAQLERPLTILVGSDDAYVDAGALRIDL